MLVVNGAAIPHLRLGGLDKPQLVLIRIRGGAPLDLDDSVLHLEQTQEIYAIALLVSPASDTGQHLRILAHLAGRFEEPSFLEHWMVDSTEQALKETLLRDDRMRVVRVRPDCPAAVLVGRRMDQVPLPPGSMLALVRRRGDTFIPEPGQRIQLGDRLTVIGDSAAMAELEERLASCAAEPPVKKARRRWTPRRSTSASGSPKSQRWGPSQRGWPGQR
jgi:APA family basic amino acid/polyamine antiporter